MRKRVWSFVVVTCLFLSLLPFGAIAYSPGYDGMGPRVLEGGQRDFKWPVPDYYNIQSCFYDHRNHCALDIYAPIGTSIVASYDGTVVATNTNGSGGFGNYVAVQHNYKKLDGSSVTLYTRYSHMNTVSVSVGTKVYAGSTRLGTVGATGNVTGPHLDYQILQNDWNNYQTNSIDPYANDLLEFPSGLFVTDEWDCGQSYFDLVKAQYASPIPSGFIIPEGIYTIHSARDWNKAIDISGDSTASGANIQLYDFLDNDVQKFRVVKEGSYYCIQSVHSGMWLDVASPVQENRANVQLWHTNQNNEEKWTFEDAGNGYVYIRNYYGNYVDLAGDSTANNTNIQLYNTKESDSQRWRLIPVAEPIDVKPGVYTIHSAWDWNKVLDIAGSSMSVRSRLQLFDYLDSDVQKFRVIKEGNYYFIQSIYSGLWLDVAYPVTESHSNVQLLDLNTMPEQKWQFEDAGNGYVYIRNYYGNYVDITGDSVTNNANIQVYHAKENDSQRWRLIAEPEPTEIPEGVYTIHSAWDSAKVLDIASDSMENRANIQLYDFLDNEVQKFRVVKDGKYYHIQSVYSGLWLDVAQPNTESHSNVQLYNLNTRPEECWQFEDAGNGYVSIRNYYGNYVDIQYDSLENHANIQVYHRKDGNSERWRLIPETYTIWIRTGEGTALTPQLQVRYGENCNLSASYVSRQGDTLKGWYLHRPADDKWFATGVGWYTEAEITERGLTKQLYVPELSMKLEDSWLNLSAAPLVNAFEFIAVWTEDHDHTIAAIPEVPASCTMDGMEAYWKCDDCGKLFTDEQGLNEISAPIVIPAAGHAWDDGVITQKPTEAVEGVKTFTCTVCGETKTEAISVLEPSNPFSDVSNGKFYTDAVLWAVSRSPQITNGYADGTFRPDQTCTRGQVMTFLWRAKGCPEPVNAVNPFTDMKSSDYYYKAVLWGLENGITTGKTPTTFDPAGECTRAHVVTFLWRMEGSLAPMSTEKPFTDVPAGKFYTNAVFWALENNITTGRTSTTFNPDGACTRGHVVTFLYRDIT